MMPNEKQKICDGIFQYITKELDEWTDNEIFSKTSMEDLGALYYNHIINEVANADAPLLNSVIRTVKPRNIECVTQEDYYIALCKILYLIKLPSKVMADVEREYNEIFVQKYSAVTQKYQLEVNRINNELKQIKAISDSIKNSTQSYSLVRDISTDEQKLYELCLKCNTLKTRKKC